MLTGLCCGDRQRRLERNTARALIRTVASSRWEPKPRRAGAKACFRSLRMVAVVAESGGAAGGAETMMTRRRRRAERASLSSRGLAEPAYRALRCRSAPAGRRRGHHGRPPWHPGVGNGHEVEVEVAQASVAAGAMGAGNSWLT
jgi:hypothetical protein